jgi:DNA modification methylase
MAQWQNRITKYGTLPADQFIANPQNPRRHPMDQREAVKGSLDTLGWIAPVIVSARSQYLIDGHERVMQALSQGDDTPVPYIEVDLSDEEEALALASFDWITQMAVYDKDSLDALLQGIETENDALQAVLDDLAAQNGIDFMGDAPLEDAGPQMDRGQELAAHYGTASGQIWQLGKHRLAIGDSTDRGVIEGLMQGKRASMMFTDPPYGIAFKGQLLSHTTIDGVKVNGHKTLNTTYSAIENDTLSGKDLKNFCEKFLLVCMRTGIEAWYICFSQLDIDLLLSAMRSCQLEWRSIIAWVKNESTISNKDYKLRYEPIVYGQSGGAFYGERYHEEDVWEITRTLSNDLHPTMKPVDLVVRAINNSSEKDAIILDPFLGSGTTLIAAEQTDRICYGFEISPEYAAVIIQRWETFTGQTAHLESPLNL